ncbi:AAA domain-containing protein [Rugamonas sp. FT82W]|uniref:AAA domain-containing protein n=1 Tax=Duganella vulcania TaxID=2692166 RepID=A0A845G3Y1_9BURK|nr:MoxR family ATPase [Duganella vulcania]MYM88152.1 AAA domain-containing protein [Duganella vulcania]
MTTWNLYDPERPPEQTPLPAPPQWRRPGRQRADALAQAFRPTPALLDAVNAALHLRRPLLITGKPGTGKTSLIYSVARQLMLGDVLVWAINSRSTLQESLYQYDALARLQHIQQLQAGRAKSSASGDAGWGAQDIAMFLSLGPLGTALAAKTPRALLIDEIDKSDIDLPNDLLNVLDTGRYTIPELQRIAAKHPEVEIATVDGDSVMVERGEINFSEYPFIVMTSNGERDFPAAFLRRCVQCEIREPDAEELANIVGAHFGDISEEAGQLIEKFVSQRSTVALATDQLLNAVHLQQGGRYLPADEERLLSTLFQNIG